MDTSFKTIDKNFPQFSSKQKEQDCSIQQESSPLPSINDDQLDQFVYGLNSQEQSLQSILNKAPNVIDILNQNLKLKQALNKLTGAYRRDVISLIRSDTPISINKIEKEYDNKDIHEQITFLQKQSEKDKARIAMMTQQSMNFEQKIRQLKAEIEELQKSSVKFKGGYGYKLQVERALNSELRGQIASIEENNDILEKEIKQLKTKLKELENKTPHEQEVSDLRSDLEKALNQVSISKRNSDSTSEAMCFKNKTLEQEVLLLRKKIQKSSQLFGSLQKDYLDLEQQICKEDTPGKIIFERELSQMRREYESLMVKEISHRNCKIRSMQKEIDELKKKVTKSLVLEANTNSLEENVISVSKISMEELISKATLLLFKFQELAGVSINENKPIKESTPEFLLNKFLELDIVFEKLEKVIENKTFENKEIKEKLKNVQIELENEKNEKYQKSEMVGKMSVKALSLMNHINNLENENIKSPKSSETPALSEN